MGVYFNRHGEDTTLYATEADAYREAARVVLMNLDRDIAGASVRDRIEKSLEYTDYKTAIGLYNEWSAEEVKIAIFPEPVVTTPLSVTEEILAMLEQRKENR